MVVAIFGLFWSSKEGEFYIKMKENTCTIYLKYEIYRFFFCIAIIYQLTNHISKFDVDESYFVKKNSINITFRRAL